MKPEGNLNAQSLEVVESETLDDNASKRTENTIGGYSSQDHGRINPGYGIEHGFGDMGEFDVMICNASIVLSNSLESDITLSVIEDTSAGGIVGEDEEDENTP
jgi:hypothetical protein